MSEKNSEQLLQEKIGYNFKNISTLNEALTHPSCLGLDDYKKSTNNYERLEFLGDSVISFLMAKILISKFPTDSEGMLTKRRAALTNKKTLCKIGKKLKLLAHINMAKDESELEIKTTDKILEDALEALVGALFLDAGLEVCENFILKNWANLITQDVCDDPKTLLQQWSQSKGLGQPKYQLISTHGEDHKPIFKMAVSIKNLPKVSAEGTSKKEATENAAICMLREIEKK